MSAQSERAARRLMERAWEAFAKGDQAEYEKNMTGARSRIFRRENSEEAVSRALTGEYRFLTALPLIKYPARCVAVYNEALDLLGGPSTLVPQDVTATMGFDGVFAMFWVRRGQAREDMGVLSAVIEAFSALKGGDSCEALLGQAEYALYRGDFDKAEALAYKVSYLSENSGNGLHMLGAARVLGQIAVAQGNQRGWEHALNAVDRAAARSRWNPVMASQYALLVRCQLMLSVGVWSEMPEWLREGSFGSLEGQSIWGINYQIHGRNLSFQCFSLAFFLYALRLVADKQYPRALAAIEMVQDYTLNHTLLLQAEYDILQGLCYIGIGDEGSGVRHIDAGMAIAARDGLLALPAMFIPLNPQAVLASAERVCPQNRGAVEKLGDGFLRGSAAIHMARQKLGGPRNLTRREREIASLAARGLRNREIAQHLGVGEDTVKYHMKNIFSKLEIDSRVKLADML